jgi:small GTP-binding protein
MAQRYLFKTIIAGSGGTGKTTLLFRFKNNKFLEDTKITIGVEFSIAQVGQATLQIWDFAGEERFRDMLPSFCLGANGCMMVFDLGNAKSFFDLEEWYEIIRNNTKNIPMTLVGTKLDLIEEGAVEQAVSEEAIQEFLEKHNILDFIKISSKNGQNVTEAFNTITKCMLKNAGVPM